MECGVEVKHTDLRRLLNLQGLNRREEPELSELLDQYQKRSDDEVTDISLLINKVGSYKQREKEKLEQDARDRALRNPNHEGRDFEARRALIEASIERGASAVPKTPQIRHIYDANLVDDEWKLIKEKNLDNVVYMRIRVLIPQGMWADPKDAMVRGDKFELHRILMKHVSKD